MDWSGCMSSVTVCIRTICAYEWVLQVVVWSIREIFAHPHSSRAGYEANARTVGKTAARVTQSAARTLVINPRGLCAMSLMMMVMAQRSVRAAL